MARMPKLKVFRTPIGFHDAYIAAPSQKAALEAWGSDSNLFASGAAERVEDPELMREPLAHPGQIIRRLRGSMSEHMAALPKRALQRATRTEVATSAKGAKPVSARKTTSKVTPKPKPRPSRATLDPAEAALAEAQKRRREADAQIARKQAELDRERRKIESELTRERERLNRSLKTARARYERAMAAWRVD